MPWFTVENMDPDNLLEEEEMMLTGRHPSGLGYLWLFPQTPRTGGGRCLPATTAKEISTVEEVLDHLRKHAHHYKWNIAEILPDMPDAVKNHNDLWGLDDKSRAANTPSCIGPELIRRLPTEQVHDTCTIQPSSIRRIIPTDSLEGSWKQLRWHEIDEEDRAQAVKFVKSGKDVLVKACAVGFDTTHQAFGALWRQQSTVLFGRANNGEEMVVERKDPAQASQEVSQEVSDYFSSLLEREGETLSLADPAQDLQEVSDYSPGLLAENDDPAQVSKEVSEYFSGLPQEQGNVIVANTTRVLHTVAAIDDEGGMVVEAKTLDLHPVAELDERAIPSCVIVKTAPQNVHPVAEFFDGATAGGARPVAKDETGSSPSTHADRDTASVDWSEIEPGEQSNRHTWAVDWPKVCSGSSTEENRYSAPADWSEIEPGEQPNCHTRAVDWLSLIHI